MTNHLIRKNSFFTAKFCAASVGYPIKGIRATCRRNVRKVRKVRKVGKVRKKKGGNVRKNKESRKIKKAYTRKQYRTLEMRVQTGRVH